jgi:hypothetical protein
VRLTSVGPHASRGSRVTGAGPHTRSRHQEQTGQADGEIAVLAWGSIIWARRALKVSTDSSDGRLTLVIDEMHGFACTTYHARSAFDDLVSGSASPSDGVTRDGVTM